MKTLSHESYPDTHHDHYSKTVFGFWVYLLTDFTMFATFFACYAVFRNNTFGGPPGKEIFNFQIGFYQSLLMLFAAFTSGIAGVFAHRKNKQATLVFFTLTLLLGLLFLGFEWNIFEKLVQGGNDWARSAFLSSYYTLLGMHALHLILALLWTLVLLIPLFKEDITDRSLRRLTCLRMFWQFLNIVWIFIFTFVYLTEVVT